jgi:hypothetical protein
MGNNNSDVTPTRIVMEDYYNQNSLVLLPVLMDLVHGLCLRNWNASVRAPCEFKETGVLHQAREHGAHSCLRVVMDHFVMTHAALAATFGASHQSVENLKASSNIWACPLEKS